MQTMEASRDRSKASYKKKRTDMGVQGSRIPSMGTTRIQIRREKHKTLHMKRQRTDKAAKEVHGYIWGGW